MSLDHLQPISECNGKPNHKPTNLVTCCRRCNSAKGNRKVNTFCRAIAEYLGSTADPKAIERHVRSCARRAMTKPRLQAKALIAKRGSAAKALAQ